MTAELERTAWPDAASLRPVTFRRYAAPVATAAVLLAFVVTVAVDGLPLDRFVITAWCLALVVATGLGLPWTTLALRTLGWVAVFAAFMLYELARGVADALGTQVDFTGPLAVDRWLAGGAVPTIWLQQHLYVDGVLRWFDAPLSLLYMSHFFVAYAVMLWLQVRRPDRFWPFVLSWIMTTYLACLVFLLRPTAPPWMASRDGLIDPVERTATIGLGDVNLHMAARLVDLGRATLNQVAAFPSLHAAYPAILLFFFWGTSRWWLRAVLAAYTVSMGFMLVLTAEHWVSDVLAGWTVAFVAVVVVARATAAVRRRRADGPMDGPP